MAPNLPRFTGRQSADNITRRLVVLAIIVALLVPLARAQPTTTAAPTERSGEEIVRAQCAKCHASGEGGAPKIGDRDAWIPRYLD
jgi:cytochrome c5